MIDPSVTHTTVTHTTVTHTTVTHTTVTPTTVTPTGEASQLQSTGAAAESARSGPLWRPLALGLALVLAVLAVLMLNVPGPTEIRAFAESAGPLGLVVFVAIFVGLTLTPVPSSALAATAGLLYGFVGGALIAVPSAIVAALIAYYCGRALGADALLHYGKQPALRAVTFLNRRGFTAVLTVRLVPLLPFWLVNYSSGVAGIPVLGYLLATSIGILPGMLGFVAVGAFGTDIFSWQFAATITAVFVFSMSGAYAVQRFTRRGQLTD